MKQGDRLLVTETTKHYLPDGYNWVNSEPIVDAILDDGSVMLHQVGYPYRFIITAEQAAVMAQAMRDSDDT